MGRLLAANKDLLYIAQRHSSTCQRLASEIQNQKRAVDSAILHLAISAEYNIYSYVARYLKIIMSLVNLHKSY